MNFLNLIEMIKSLLQAGFTSKIKDGLLVSTFAMLLKGEEATIFSSSSTMSLELWLLAHICFIDVAKQNSQDLRSDSLSCCYYSSSWLSYTIMHTYVLFTTCLVFLVLISTSS